MRNPIELQEIAASGLQKPTRKDDVTAQWLMGQFGLSPVEAQARILGGAAGLDGFHFDQARRSLSLYVYRASTFPRELVAPLRELAETGLDQLFGAEESEQAPLALRNLRRLAFEEQASIDRVYVVALCNGDAAAVDRSVTLRDLLEQVESKRYLLDGFFQGAQRKLVLQVRNALDGTVLLETGIGAGASHTYEVGLGQHITTRMPAAGRTVDLTMGFVSLYDLHLMHQKMKHRLFERNIRAGLSSDRPPNRAIREALAAIVLEGRRPPESFAFHHNGVTIAAQKIEFDGERARITEPRVLNGAQSVTSFSTFMKEKVTPEVLTLRKQVLEAIRVPARIVTGAAPESVVEITLNTNRQNPVEPWNLRASDPIQLELQDKFRDEANLFYERQDGSFETNEDEDVGDKPIQLRKLAQALLAVQGQLSRMHSLPQVFESRNQYEETFPRSLLNVDVRKLVLVYKIQKSLTRALRAIEEKNGRLQFLRPGARNLVWALLTQALLNIKEKEREKLLAEHGLSLTVTSDLNALIESLAEGQVRMAIQDALKDDHYKNLVEQESFSFLRTTEFCTRSFDAATERYASWQRRTLLR